MQSSATTDQVARLKASGRRLEPRVVYDPEIPKGSIAGDAIKVIRRLDRHGHKAYLVGGCVRDVLCGEEPSDFDLVTAASLKEVKGLFSNSRVIGRRFPIALIYFKKRTLEVSTLRSGESTTDGMVDSELADLAPDPLAADSWFRDFTINALIYDPLERTLFDYTDGLDDLEKRRLRSIGNPYERFQSDPVRIIRGLRYAGRLNLDIEEQTLDAMRQCTSALEPISRRRLKEEIWKILRSKELLGMFRLLDRIGVLPILFPQLPGFDESRLLPLSHPLWTYLYHLDHVEMRDRTDAVLLAMLFLKLVSDLEEEDPDLNELGHEVLKDQIHNTLEEFGAEHSMARKTRARARDSLLAQLRLLKGPDTGRHPARFFRRREARDALTLYRLLKSGQDPEAPNSLKRWEEKHQLFLSGAYRDNRKGGKRRRRKRRRRRSKG